MGGRASLRAMRRAATLVLVLLIAAPARAQVEEPELRALAERLYGPVPPEASVVLHPLPWGAAPPVPGTTHVLVAQDAHTALLAMIALMPSPGGAPVPTALALGQAEDPAGCVVPPGMPEAPVLEEFAASREENESGLGQPIVTVAAADGAALIGLSWRVGERGSAAQALALFRADGARLREMGCFVVRLDANVTYEGGGENAPVRRRRVSNVWRIETGPGAETPLLLRDTARPQRPLAVRLNAETGRYEIIAPPPREERPRRR